MAALLIRMLMWPSSFSTSLITAWGAEESVMSAVIAILRGYPFSAISATTASTSERVRERQATEAPAAAKARAVARPMPRPAPVIRTVLLVRVDAYLVGDIKG